MPPKLERFDFNHDSEEELQREWSRAEMNRGAMRDRDFKTRIDKFDESLSRGKALANNKHGARAGTNALPEVVRVAVICDMELRDWGCRGAWNAWDERLGKVARGVDEYATREDTLRGFDTEHSAAVLVDRDRLNVGQNRQRVPDGIIAKVTVKLLTAHLIVARPEIRPGAREEVSLPRADEF